VTIKNLVDLIKKQLLPYRHPEDINRDETKWEITESDYLRDWLLSTLKSCFKRNKCEKKGKCIYYEYSDQARNNFRICKEFILLIEGGSIDVVPSNYLNEGKDR